jgi:hypothetical protein
MGELTGPTIYSVLMDEATMDLFLLLERRVERLLGEFRPKMIADYEDAVRKAYVRGVRDGFQQGVERMERKAKSGSAGESG